MYNKLISHHDKNSSIEDNLNFILSHFEHQHELFPRTIMTFNTKQVKIDYETNTTKIIQKILDYFCKADYKDCRINSFPYETEHLLDLEIKNKIAADFIFIDLDFEDFGIKEKLDRTLQRTLKKMSEKLKDVKPTVLWTGKGYHIYQPLDGFVLEKEITFYEFLPYIDKDLTSEFLRFSEKLFTNGKADKNHSPSIRSCLVRIPGSINSKNGEQVKIIQRWDGNRPNIRLILSDFLQHLIQKRIDKIKMKNKINLISKKNTIYKSNNKSNSILWIDNLLQIPIEDYRKFCLWRIIIPYLVNIRKLSNEDSTIISNEWLQKCNQTRKLNFNPNQNIKNDLKGVKNYLPISNGTLKKEYNNLYKILESKEIFSKKDVDN